MWQTVRNWLAQSGQYVGESDHRRWIVVDVEATGLDARTERLVSIAAIAVHLHDHGSGRMDMQIHLGDSFEVVLKHDEPLQFSVAPPSERVKRNVLVHGIGLGAQAQGVPATEALGAFVAFAGDAPLLGYHSWFDQTLIEGACHRQGIAPPAGAWVDVENVARGVDGELRRMALDGWLCRYGIQCTVRHDAAADTLATCELLMRLWRRIDLRRGTAWQALQRTAADARFLPHT
ncbi:MAG: hypothetical protein RLZZ271_10 [Pseudomonadota bacterium]|jgi:DNA polymerase-3 subunit epsilon